MNKKSQSEIILNVFALIVLFIVILIFWFLLAFEVAKPGIEKQVINAQENNEGNLILINYLRTPVEVEIDKKNKTINIADLIILSIQKNNYEILDKKTKELFNLNNNYWYISLWKDDGLIYEFNRENFQPRLGITEVKVETFIPNYNKELIKVSMFVQEGVEITEIQEALKEAGAV